MEKYHDKVRVICLACKEEQDNEMYYGENEKYPDDFSIECNHCDNTEEGNPHLQSFEILKTYGRFETKK